VHGYKDAKAKKSGVTTLTFWGHVMSSFT